MSIFETNVAGVTFYNVDFYKIKKNSRVALIREPQNPYDENAVAVHIDGKMTGHIKKELAPYISESIRTGKNIKASVNSVIGSNKTNKGILLRIKIEDENRKDTNQDLGESIRIIPKLKVIRPTRFTKAIIIETPTYSDYLNKHGRMPPPLESLPPEPNYSHLYKKETNPIERFFRNDFEDFKRKAKARWEWRVTETKKRNIKRKEEKSFLLKLEFQDAEFKKWRYNYPITKSLRKHGVSVPKNSDLDILRSHGSITAYEDALAPELQVRYPTFRQAKIRDITVDFLVIDMRRSRLWVIEVDGGVHTREQVAHRDSAKEEIITSSGIGIIRVSNAFIQKRIDDVMKAISQNINEP